MTERIRQLCSLLHRTDFFADVGCDHGYCTEYMLRSGLCKRAIVTDVSAECLAKAETLLSDYIRSGVCSSLCTDGLQGVPQDVSLVLISGMGGMEIKKILQNGFLPAAFVLQPMRDGRALRTYLIGQGAKIVRDFTFFAEGKFYDVIAGYADGGTAAYSEAEKDFGRENIVERGEAFLSFLREETDKLKGFSLREMSEESRRALQEKLNYYQGVYSGEIK